MSNIQRHNIIGDTEAMDAILAELVDPSKFSRDTLAAIREIVRSTGRDTRYQFSDVAVSDLEADE